MGSIKRPVFRRKAAVIAALAATALAGGASAETVVLRNFTLIDGTGKAPIANQALIITDGKVSWVGPSARLKAPASATTEDLSGKYLMPGLIDSHVHLGLVNGIAQDLKYQTPENIDGQLHLYAAYGVTSVQTLGTEKDLIFPIRDAERATRPDKARVFTVGQGVVFKGSYGGVPGLDQQVATPEEARRMVDAQAAKNVDMIKLWVDDEFGQLSERMPPAISTAVIDQARKDGKKTVAHIFYYDNAAELTREGVSAFAHEVRDRAVDAPLLSQMKAKSVWQMAATLSREASFTYATLPFLNDPFFTRGVTPDVLTQLASPERAQKLSSAPNFPKYAPTLRYAMQNFAAEAKAGIRYGMGTDSGPTARFPGYFAHWELELMVQAGITPLQALTAATSANAEFIGARDIGTVQTGKWADLLVLDKNPVADIRNTRTIHEVFIAGKKVPTIWQTCTGRPADACGAAQ
ncbi:amidohydrolase family protein [Sphingomonas sp.]|uniref:amidohydrolase family protein n=1 Tax=Sphingomonas sp. TaxID=28214 RepID=UPI003B3BD59B